MDYKKQIKEILLEELVMEEEELEKGIDARISDYIDSLETIETAMLLEKELDITIPDSLIDRWVTIRDIITTVEEICLQKAT